MENWVLSDSSPDQLIASEQILTCKLSSKNNNTQIPACWLAPSRKVTAPAKNLKGKPEDEILQTANPALCDQRFALNYTSQDVWRDLISINESAEGSELAKIGVISLHFIIRASGILWSRYKY